MTKRAMLGRITGAVVFFGVVAALTVGNGNSFGDVPLTRHADLLECNGTDPDTFERTYSLHMDYDTAVIEAEKELLGKGWIESSRYADTTLNDPDGGVFYVTINRARAVRVQGHVDSLADDFNIARLTNAHGWVIIQTRRHLSRAEAILLTGLMKLQGKFGEPVSYAKVAPNPINAINMYASVNVHRGTRELESDGKTIVIIQTTNHP